MHGGMYTLAFLGSSARTNPRATQIALDHALVLTPDEAIASKLPPRDFDVALLIGPSCQELRATDRWDRALATATPATAGSGDPGSESKSEVILAGFDLMLLLPPMEAPQVHARTDPDVDSAFLSRELLEALVEHDPDVQAEMAVFAALRQLASADWPKPRLLVRELLAKQREPRPPVPLPELPVCVIAHRGPAWHVSTCLAALRTQGATARTSVGFDGPLSPGSDDVLRDFPEVRFESFQPAGVGPFVIREALALDRNCPTILSQDSDDIATLDRLPHLHEALGRHGSDIVGSHYIELDEIEQRVRPVRLPLEVLDALVQRAGHAQLHGTTLIRRSSFFAVGGYSTNRAFANDTQFLLRAAFTLAITNTDAFLYCRRRHRSALTETVPLDSETRADLDMEWRRAFLAIAREEITLDDSALRAVKRYEPFERHLLQAGSATQDDVDDASRICAETSAR